jgi:uncharacterized protein (DUF1330 family)
MSAYIIANNHLTGYEGQVAAYRAKVTETAQSFGGRYLARGVPAHVLEGQWLPRQRNVISVWKDTAAAEKFWFSDAYQKEIRPNRIGTSVNDIGLYEGTDSPPDDYSNAAFMLILAQMVVPVPTIQEYNVHAAELSAKYGAKYLVRGKKPKVLEGEFLNRAGTMLIMWPSMNDALTFWNSPEYQKIKPLRAGPGNVFDIALFAADKH